MVGNGHRGIEQIKYINNVEFYTKIYKEWEKTDCGTIVISITNIIELSKEDWKEFFR